MKTLKIWLTVIFISIILVLAALVLALYRNLNSQWQAETTAAQYALNHSPISHIDSYQVFTSDGLEDVFTGTDVFSQKWYTFVAESGSQLNVHTVSATDVISKNKVEAAAAARHIHPVRVILGYVGTNNTAIHVSQAVVWEVYGTNAAGKHVYEYFDGKTGKFVWQYVLST